MSNSNQLNPDTGPSLQDLQARRKALGQEQLLLEERGCPYDPSKSEALNALAQHQHQQRLAALIREQLEIMGAMRKTASGPAKAGGKRAKKAPLDTAALDDAIFN